MAAERVLPPEGYGVPEVQVVERGWSPPEVGVERRAWNEERSRARLAGSGSLLPPCMGDEQLASLGFGCGFSADIGFTLVSLSRGEPSEGLIFAIRLV